MARFFTFLFLTLLVAATAQTPVTKAPAKAAVAAIKSKVPVKAAVGTKAPIKAAGGATKTKAPVKAAGGTKAPIKAAGGSTATKAPAKMIAGITKTTAPVKA
jgi:hypothetical protein